MTIPPTGVWWHVFPLGFLGAEREALPAGSPVAQRLPRLEHWLEYAVALGVEGIVLGPVFAAETHGYDTIDYYRVDSRLGTEADLVSLVEAAHDSGLKIVLDGVFNHVGRGFGPFEDVVAHGSRSQFASWFRARRPETSGGSNAESSPDPGAGLAVDVFEGHQHLVALNHDEPAVVDHVSAVMGYWCARGVDGWRLDAAYAIPVRFIRQVLTRLREKHPGVWVFGELIHGDYVDFVRESGIDTVTQYELWKAIGSAINDANFFELAHALDRHDGFLAEFAPVTFLGNHDTTRIASQLDDPRHLPHALAVLFAVGGTPVIYAGDEQAFRGIKYEREGGDDEVRPAFPESPQELSRLGQDTFSLHQRLIGLRSARPWLATARTSVSELANTAVLMVTGPRLPGAAGESDGERLAVALSLQDASLGLALPEGDWHLLLGDGVQEDGQIVLPAHGWAVLVSSAPS